MSGPRVTSGRDSEQTVCTPRDLLDAVEKRFGLMDADLAASGGNSVARNWFGPGSVRCAHVGGDSLKADWTEVTGNLWLNPPFGNIAPWAKKCAETPLAGRNIFLLVPLTTANWACDYIHGLAHVFGLNPRVTFIGHRTAFPKDLMLAVYTYDQKIVAMGEDMKPRFETWRWKEKP